VNVVPYFAVLALLVGALLVLYRLPYARFLLHRIRQHSWPAVEATLSRAGIVSVVLKDSVQWDSVFQVSYEANGKPVFAYYGLHSYDCEPTEAQSLQTTWDGAKVIVRYDPKQPEGFVLDKNYTGGYLQTLWLCLRIWTRKNRHS
jgi:hypothetical protein